MVGIYRVALDEFDGVSLPSSESALEYLRVSLSGLLALAQHLKSGFTPYADLLGNPNNLLIAF